MRKHFFFRALRKVMRKTPYTSDYQNYVGQNANDYIFSRVTDSLESHSGLMICKFGTIELDNYVCNTLNKGRITIKNYADALKGEYSVHKEEAFHKLCHNAGFFPEDISLLQKYCDLVKEDISQIDILGSYIIAEKYINHLLNFDCTKVDLDGFYAPFLWKNPWTAALKGKKVVVIHPFADSIKSQYDKRDKLFSNKDTLPEFGSLVVIKAVQSIANNKRGLPYSNWFEALKHMEMQLDSYDYDAVIVGCGAYGMHLCAHAKRNNKVAIQLAGWTQMLFGIYGNRWLIDQPEYSRFINDYWIRPSENERPVGAESVEKGAYW